jgi:hypothetical protein
MKSFLECEEFKTDSKIVLKEKRSKITFNNPNREKILLLKVDGCAIKEPKTLRCDYALVPCDQVEIYVELKGSDIAKAFKQIESTINLLSSKVAQLKILGFIISTRVPMQSTDVQQLKSQLKKKFNATIRIKNIEEVVDLNEIITK